MTVARSAPPARAAAADSNRDFDRLWVAFAVSTLGSAVSLGALPLIALRVTNASAAGISLMAAMAAVSTALVAVPLSPYIDRMGKRVVLVAAELVQFAMLVSVVAAYSLGALTFAHLCVAEAVGSAASVIYASAAASLIKSVVREEALGRANLRMESTAWTTMSTGPAVGGVMISAVGIASSITVDAVSFVLGALLLRRLRRGDLGARPISRTGDLRERTTAGFRHIWGHRELRALYLNAMAFGGAVMMTAPLLAYLMLRRMHLAPWQYGIALGLPAIAGLLGSILSARFTTRLGERRALLTASALRAPWIGLLLFARSGTDGLILVLVSQSGLLFAAGLFNPIFATFRMRATPQPLMGRVTVAWSVSAKVIQPLCIAAGGACAALLGVRAALLLAALVCVASAFLLPWRTADARHPRHGDGANAVG